MLYKHKLALKTEISARKLTSWQAIQERSSTDLVPGGGGTLNIYLLGVCRSTSKKGGLRHGHNPKKGGLRHGYESKKGGLRRGHESKKGGS